MLKRPPSSSILGSLVWSSLGARSSELCPESTGLARLELAQPNAHQFSEEISGFKPFFPKNPNFDLSNPKLAPNNVYRSYAWNYTQWCLKLEIKTSFHQNSTIHQTFTIFNNNNNKSHHQFTNRKSHWVNSSTTCFKTTSTTNNHEFTHNSTTTTSFFINFTQKHNIPTYITFGMQTHHQ